MTEKRSETVSDLLKEATQLFKEMNPDKLRKHEKPMTKARKLMSELDIIKEKITKKTQEENKE